MTNIIIVTSVRERDETMRNVKARLKELYLTDVSISVVQSNMSTIKVYQLVNRSQVLAGVYRFIMIPVIISYDQLEGIDPSIHISINKLLSRIEELKQEVIDFAKSHKTKRNVNKLTKFKSMVNRSFFGE